MLLEGEAWISAVSFSRRCFGPVINWFQLSYIIQAFTILSQETTNPFTNQEVRAIVMPKEGIRVCNLVQCTLVYRLVGLCHMLLRALCLKLPIETMGISPAQLLCVFRYCSIGCNKENKLLVAFCAKCCSCNLINIFEIKCFSVNNVFVVNNVFQLERLLLIERMSLFHVFFVTVKIF